MNRRTTTSLALTAVFALSLGLSQSACSAWFETTAEDVAEEYLELVRDGDYSEVMEYVQERVDLDGAAEVYLDEDIRTSDWDFEVLGEVDDVSGDHTSVEYKIEDDDGDNSIGTFDFVESGDEWELVNPLVKASVENDVLTYGDVNGIYTDEQVFWLLPGLYNMYEDPGEYVEVKDHGTFVVTKSVLDEEFNDEDEEYSSRLINVDYSISDDVIELVKDQADFHFDQCQSITDPDDPDCPLVAEPWGFDQIYLENAILDYDEIDEVSWEVTDAPEFEVGPGIAINMRIDEPGTATITVTDNDGTEHESDCRISTFQGDTVFTGPDELTFDHLDFWAICDGNLYLRFSRIECSLGKVGGIT